MVKMQSAEQTKITDSEQVRSARRQRPSDSDSQDTVVTSNAEASRQLFKEEEIDPATVKIQPPIVEQQAGDGESSLGPADDGSGITQQTEADEKPNEELTGATEVNAVSAVEEKTRLLRMR
nr:hypothetical protein [Methylomarinum sp. Ch1-1]MDP4522125.1 hypothetical protein [Methylomarinum sp. Ch1-1]